MSSISSLITLIRPHQWSKNLLVFIGVFFAHKWYWSEYLTSAVFLFFSFCALASSIYIYNDYCDIEQDKLHPTKKNRPLAGGKVSKQSAIIFGLILFVFGFTLAIFSQSILSIAFLSVYVLLNLLYSKLLKHITIIDILVLSSGYLLRILAGTDGINIPTSSWLLLCGLSVTMLLGFGKRLAEKHNLDSYQHRQVVQKYDESFLLIVITITATLFLVFYGFYSLDADSLQIHGRKLILTYPWVILGIFRYLQLIVQKDSLLEDPSTIILHDKLLLFTLSGWFITFILVTTYAKL